MSGFARSRSEPVNALAKAALYQVLLKGAPGKLPEIETAPADPSVAVVGVQERAIQSAFTVIVTLLVRVAPQMLAAN
jgi:hypothetical protein